MFSKELQKRAETLLESYRAAGKKLATAESCTGGLIAGLLTEIAGSSDVVERGFVTYSNEAKMECLGVAASVIAAQGAVSAETALAMAEGALARSHADVALSVTGIAGPGGGSTEKPVGLVHFGLARKGAAPLSQRHVFPGGRGAVRQAAVATGLALLAEGLET